MAKEEPKTPEIPTVSVTEIKPEDKKEDKQQSPQPINIDFSELSARLARIEYILSNTLEVKIIE